MSPGQPMLGAPATPIRNVWKLGFGVSERAAFRRICVKRNPARGSLSATREQGVRGGKPGGEGVGTRLLPTTPRGCVSPPRSPHPMAVWSHPLGGIPHRNGCTLTPTKPSLPANHGCLQTIIPKKTPLSACHCSQKTIIPSKPLLPAAPQCPAPSTARAEQG